MLGIRLVGWLFALLGWVTLLGGVGGTVWFNIETQLYGFSDSTLHMLFGTDLDWLFDPYYVGFTYAGVVGTAVLLFFFWGILAGLAGLGRQGGRIQSLLEDMRR